MISRVIVRLDVEDLDAKSVEMTNLNLLLGICEGVKRKSWGHNNSLSQKRADFHFKRYNEQKKLLKGLLDPFIGGLNFIFPDGLLMTQS